MTRASLISVIVTTFEREDALDGVLRGLSRQTDRTFEVVIADDGSGPATAALIEAWRPRLGAELIHVRQEHDGFRAAASRNRAIIASSGAYCVFLDGDCIPRGDFLAAHRRLAEPGWFVAGNRTLLSRELTETVLRDRQEPETWTLATLVGHRINGSVNQTLPLMRLPLGPLRKWRARSWRGVRTCNLGVWRADLDRVDGFDASFSGWGLEDSDLAIRLQRSGVLRKDGRFATGVLHLWHPPAGRAEFSLNQARIEEAGRKARIRACAGLSALSGQESRTRGTEGGPAAFDLLGRQG